MNTITLTIAATPDNLKRIADAFGDVIDETLKADDVPAHRVSAGQQQGTPLQKKSAEIPAAGLPEVTENVAKEPENVAKEPETTEKREITMTELRTLGVKLTKEGKTAEIRALLDKYGAPKITELPEADFAAFYTELEALA